MISKLRSVQAIEYVHLAIKAVFFIALIVFLMQIYADNDTVNININKFAAKLSKELKQDNGMKKASDRDVVQFIGIEPDDYSQVVYYRSTKELAVEELLIVKAKDSDELDAVADAVDERVQSQIDVYASYGPEQVKQLKNCVKYRKGRYYFYCTSDNATEYEEVFRDAIQ